MGRFGAIESGLEKIVAKTRRYEEKHMQSKQLELGFGEVPLQLRLERQYNPIADVVSALIAVVRPILEGTLYALKADVVREGGGYENIKLKMLPRLYRQGDGDCGLCFEYAVHDALNRQDSMVLERIDSALRTHCKITGNKPTSILFGAEKSGALQIINTVKERLTDESLLLGGSRGRPVKLKKHIDNVAAAFRRSSARPALPYSISGLWKADLFTGFADSDRWVGTSVKINPDHLEPAKGLRIGIVPSRQGKSDKTEQRDKLIVCPLPYDGAFMEIYYRAWGIVQQFIASDAQMPKESALPRPDERQVTSLLVDRREFPVLEVVEVLSPLAQPELLETSKISADIEFRRKAIITTGAVLSPIARQIRLFG